MNVSAADPRTFKNKQVKISEGVQGTLKFIHYVVTTGDPDDTGKHFHFKQGVDYVEMIGYNKSGDKIISSRGDCSMGGDTYYFNAAHFSVNDTNAYNLGITASMVDHATIIIHYQKKEPCDYDYSSWSNWEPDGKSNHVRFRTGACKICDGPAQPKDLKETGSHRFDTVEYVPATCIREGLKTEMCIDCRYKKETTLDRNPNNHIDDHYRIHHDLTCTQDETNDWYCSGCNAYLSTETLTTHPGHNWVWEVDTTLSCTSNYTGHKRCTRSCHNPDVDGPKETAFDTVFASAPGHNYTKFVCDQPATCTEPGSGHYECSNEINGKVCGAHGDTVTIPATGHHITYDKVTEKPSVYTNGTRTYYCEYCKQPVTTRDILHRNFNIYLGGKRVTMITKGDSLVWNGSYGEQGSDGGKTSTDDVNSLVESNWYYDY